MGHLVEGIFVGIWLVLNALEAVWIYFYVQTSVDPNPHNGANITHSRWLGFKICMIMVGIIIALGNTHIFRIGITRDIEHHRGDKLLGKPKWSTRRILFYVFVVVPVMLWFTVIPAFGSFIILPFAQKWAWNHRCDSFPMYAILDARGYKDAVSTPSVARFYQTGSTQSLFTYLITSDTTKLFWTFQIRSFDIPQSSIPLDYFPTLQNIQYAFGNVTLSGTCTLPVSPGNPTTNSTACLSGTFNPNNFLSFNLTSNVPLNNATSFSTTPSTSTLLRTIDEQWAFGTTDAPSLILDTVDPATNFLQQIVLRTAVTKYGDCSQLKVCVAGVAGREGSLVGAEVLTPMGVILSAQVPYALQCTSGKKKKVA